MLAMLDMIYIVGFQACLAANLGPQEHAKRDERCKVIVLAPHGLDS